MKTQSSSLNICVFCASSAAVSQRIFEDGALIGGLLAERGFNMVYGGTTSGLMKTVADAHKAKGGKVIGIIPQFMCECGLANSAGQDETIIVPDMAARKSKMQELSVGFIALPGGFGTLDEFFDTLANKQVGRHKKPIVLLNTDGYYNLLIDFFKHAIKCKTITPDHCSLFKIVANPQEAVNSMVS